MEKSRQLNWVLNQPIGGIRFTANAHPLEADRLIQSQEFAVKYRISYNTLKWFSGSGHTFQSHSFS